MKKFVALLFFIVIASPAPAAECPEDINPCKVMILSPQQHQWLAGTKQSSSGSVLDLAAKAAGSDASGVIAQILMQARSAVDGAAPKVDEAKKD